MIGALATVGRGHDALKLFEEALLHIEPDAIMYSAILGAVAGECVRERGSVWERVCVCARERAILGGCCVCVWEGEDERIRKSEGERWREGGRERERKHVRTRARVRARERNGECGWEREYDTWVRERESMTQEERDREYKTASADAEAARSRFEHKVLFLCVMFCKNGRERERIKDRVWGVAS